MSNRDYKNFLAGHYYHLYNRGTGKMKIFLDDMDYKFFIKCLKENIYPDLHYPKRLERLGYMRKILGENLFELTGFCLMPNHFHVLIGQRTDIAISKLMSRIGTRYAKYFNKKYNRIGSVFQDQFKAVLMETEEQRRWTVHYILNNPVRAGLVSEMKFYRYSSIEDAHPWASSMDSF